jgi:Protein of unknown function (DUF3800)
VSGEARRLPNRRLNQATCLGRSPIAPRLDAGGYASSGVAVHLAYVDDSGDQHSLVLAALLVPAGQWLAVHDQLVSFRSRLSQSTRFRMRNELKATEIVSGGGRWRSLGTPMRTRFGIYKAALEEVARMAPTVRTVGVVIPNRADPRLTSSAREVAWDILLERLRTFCTYNSSTCLLVSDEGAPTSLRRLARRKRRFAYAPAAFGGPALKVPFIQLVDDPVMRDSRQSYLIQWVDLIAYSAFRQVIRFPIVPTNLWDILGRARLDEANALERTHKGSQEPPGLIVWPSRLKPGVPR